MKRNLFLYVIFLALFCGVHTCLGKPDNSGAQAVDAQLMTMPMPMNEVDIGVAKASTLLAMHRRGRSGVRHHHTPRSSVRSVRHVRSRPAYRHHRSVRHHYRHHHRPWRYYWRPYWGPWPWWGWGYVYPFGVYYYPGWGWWYYPAFGGSYYGWWRCWYFDRWGYWYYPGLHFSAYIASRPERIVYVDNDSDDDLYYAVYSRRRIGDVYYLYRIDEPLLIERRRAVKVQLPQSKDNDYMVVAEKTDDKLPKRMHHDKSGKLVKTAQDDPGHKPAADLALQTQGKIKVEDLSKKDKRELKKMKRKLHEKDAKIQELSEKIAAIKDPEAEAQQKGLKRIEAAKEKTGSSGGAEALEHPLGIDAD